MPTDGQLAWQQDRVGMFFHFGINTYFDKEWSDGTLPAEAFYPVALDCEQWMRAALEIGARYVILTAKHHDGFCLWPTSTTAYSVASSAWRDGRGDVVREFVDAARRFGLKVGLYLSPWDRNAPQYQDPELYSRFYCEQLTELCTNYGELSELWFDGAGSEGYTYDWSAINSVIARYQPQAMVFNMGAPTIRWIGNEDGLASDPVEYVIAHTQMSNYTVEVTEFSEALYLPPECDVSIRRGWFHSDSDEPKTVEHLLAIYYRSVGLGANLLLNVPPNRDGLLDEADVRVLQGFGEQLRGRFGSPMASLITAEAAGRWRVELSTSGADHLMLEEDLSHGQQIERHRVVVDGETVASGLTIGSQRLHVTGRIDGRQVVVEVEPHNGLLRAVHGYATGVSCAPQVPENYTAPTERPE